MNYNQNHYCHNPISTKNIKIPTKYLPLFKKKRTKYLPFLHKNEKNTYLANFYIKSHINKNGQIFNHNKTTLPLPSIHTNSH